MPEDRSEKHLVFSHNTQIKAINDSTVSPDGTTIIFEGRIDDHPGEPIYNLFTVSASGDSLIRITQNDGESDIWPSYSPDSKHININIFYFMSRLQREGI